ncbi:uncharacterized protein LOC134675154 [Cydia fagiglandana]|uniref:uncharacterized protein LOC134675154 n=1 Tax=Cydia fagiglandana TaxID=1458189 RepID=UPI002FEE5346
MNAGEPICVSKHFVNKLNIRSFGNCVKLNILKTKDDSAFLHHVLQDEQMVRETPKDLLAILNNLKKNLYNNSKLDFRNFFSKITQDEGLSPVKKEEIFNCCSNALYQILPKALLESNHNAKIFRKLVKTVVFSMKRQYVIASKMVENWDFKVSPWNTLPTDKMQKILNNILFWILKYILSPMLCLNFYITSCKFDADENKLYFFWKSQWQSFYDKQILKMVKSKTLQKCDIYCLGKKFKMMYSLHDILKLKAMNREIPKLHFVLKGNNDCRPIVRYKQDIHTPADRYKMRERMALLKTLTGKPNERLESQYNTLHQEWVRQNKPVLFFVKTDLSNAFGSINKEKLMKIQNARHCNFQNSETNLNVKKKIAQQYKEMFTELHKPLLVRAGSTIYEWKQGLVQGYKYSPALSELYYTHLDETYFSHLQKSSSQLKLFTRVVDDYLYITDSLEDAFSFLEALSNYSNVNYGKTMINFSYPGIPSCSTINFLGYSYNTNTMQVSRASNVYAGPMCYKISFSTAICNPYKLLENRIGQSGIQINGHLFNLYHNTEELIWKHIFTTFCLSANKFCTILAILCNQNDILHYLSLYKKRVVVKLSNSILETMKKNTPAEIMFVYCINHLRYLAFKALSLCASKTSKCSVLVAPVKNELAKCNCIFGKWREHSSRIDFEGNCRMKAIREVCKRADLKIIMKNFEVLPEGFQCYKHID